jgi:hypothetical protein
MDEDQSEEIRWRGYAGKAVIKVEDYDIVDKDELDPRDVEPSVHPAGDSYYDVPEPENVRYLAGGEFEEWRPQNRRSRLAERERYRHERRPQRPSREAVSTGREIVIRERSSSERSRSPRQASPSEALDRYGRQRLRSEFRGKVYNKFAGILPENPFGLQPPLQLPKSDTELPDIPVLQFWTKRTSLKVLMRSTDQKNEGWNEKLGTDLTRCDIADPSDDWCGSIVLNFDWIAKRSGKSFQFIAISDAKAFTMNECPIWTYYIPKEREDSEWDLHFVLLLERNSEKLVWERRGVGKVFRAAFDNSTWDEIKLG